MSRPTNVATDLAELMDSTDDALGKDETILTAANELRSILNVRVCRIESFLSYENIEWAFWSYVRRCAKSCKSRLRGIVRYDRHKVRNCLILSLTNLAAWKMGR